MALFPFILLKKGSIYGKQRLVNHERIHLRQQAELLIILFYAWYLLEYLYHLIRLKNHNKAYMAIRFEKEAYAHDSDPGYLLNRNPYMFLKFPLH